ncbi:hypothetical protein LWM68_40900 [Niabella sp. W65]|nr:hypothetical protein [Niabella sp. W65]MCH7368532.1 hypothetical protein [Niabella sp. W65]ULT44123.1 hypothetical protein KRR40_12605 [Niabella sp. I65]
MSVVKLYTGTKSTKEALLEWEEVLEGVRKKNPAKKFTSAKDRADYINLIHKTGNQELWMQEMFPQYCTSKPAKFQIRSTRRLVGKKRYRQARRWARGLSKSTRRMMEILYKHFVEGFRVNMLLISKNEGNAERLLEPYRAQLEANARLIDIYGIQERPGKWTSTEFVTKKGASFRAVGLGQNPAVPGWRSCA